MHQRKQMKLKPGLGAFYAIWPGNGLGYNLQHPGPKCKHNIPVA